MSVHISSAVWKEKTTTGNTRNLLLALADMANDEGICWPSTHTLMERVNLQTERAIRKLLSELEEMGLIRREMRPGHSTVYHVLLTHPGTVGQGVQRDRVSTRSPYPGTVGQGTPEQPDRVPRNSGTPITVIEPSENRHGTVDAHGAQTTTTTGKPFSESDPLPLHVTNFLQESCPDWWEAHLRLALAGRAFQNPSALSSYATEILRGWKKGKNTPQAPLPEVPSHVPPPEPIYTRRPSPGPEQAVIELTAWLEANEAILAKEKAERTQQRGRHVH
jgi:hypothetical protein